MMQSETSEPSWPFFNVVSSDFELFDFTDSPMEASDFLSSETESSPVSSIVPFPIHELDLEFPVELENLWDDEMESFIDSPSEESGSSQSQSMDSGEILESEVGMVHLLSAYGGAIEMGQRELQEVILKCLRDKASPVGGPLDRLAYRLTHSHDYLTQQSFNNYAAASKAFYHTFPYGRFAHISANSAILEALPNDAEAVHIVDFDLGDGVQWASLIMAIAGQHKTLKLTSIQFEEDQDEDDDFSCTKRRLISYGRSIGVKVEVEETKIGDLVKTRNKKRGGSKEFVAFNCMMDLPHMGRGRSPKLAVEFQSLAKQLMASILTIGDGSASQSVDGCSSFGPFFEGCLVHYKALLESMEMSFPGHLGEARLAMESLFVGPQICSEAWRERWGEMRGGGDLWRKVGLGKEGLAVSRESLNEAKEMVREGGSLYGVRIGEKQNEMVLDWRGTPLVTMSAWRM